MAKEYKPVILVTGCSSGIGMSLIQRLYSMESYRVVATARKSSIESLKAKFTESDRFCIAPLDVTSIDDRQKLISDIEKKWGGVDILVNNAGISYRSVVEQMTEVEEIHQWATNYLGPMELTRLVLPTMRNKGRGKIISVSSVSGMLAMPTMSAYSASKYALEGAMESLWYEMKPLGVNVILVQPGFIRSRSFTNVYYSKKAKQVSEESGDYSDYYHHMTPFITNKMNKSWTTPDDVAKKIVKIIMKKKPPLRVPATFDAVFFYYLRRLFPRRFFHKFLFWALPGSSTWGKSYSKAYVHTRFWKNR